MMSVSFLGQYRSLPETFYAPVQPDPAPKPILLAWNQELADTLGLSQLSETDVLDCFSGSNQKQPTDAIAMAYAGHQFGSFVPQLGDGRAALLGELKDNTGKIWDIQLKGSGRTPFSRGGDGKSALGPVIREYLVSESMHYLHVPTTRSLAAIATGEKVYRDTLQPAGILTRVASSHIRVGTFEYFASRGDRDGVQQLADFAIQRHYPELKDSQGAYLGLFEKVAQAQAFLISRWMSLGFIHGVMNTDNFTVSGETLDYGPCAFMDDFNSHKVFSSIDHGGRYRYANQPPIAVWNLARFAECLMMIESEQAAYEAVLDQFGEVFQNHFHKRMCEKLGMNKPAPGDNKLIEQWLNKLQEEHLDFTSAHRGLGDRLVDSACKDSFYTLWRERLKKEPLHRDEQVLWLNQQNPAFIPRNHLVEQAIASAQEDDMSIFETMCHLLKTPFEQHSEYSEYYEPPKSDQVVKQTFCGT